MKVRKLFMLILSGVLLSLVLVGCGSSKKVFKESALENFTITRTFNDKTFEVKKNKNNYKVTDEDGNESFYALSGSKLFEHELTSKDLDVTSKTSADAEIAYRKVTLSSTSYTKGKYYIEDVDVVSAIVDKMGKNKVYDIAMKRLNANDYKSWSRDYMPLVQFTKTVYCKLDDETKKATLIDLMVAKISAYKSKNEWGGKGEEIEAEVQQAVDLWGEILPISAKTKLYNLFASERRRREIAREIREAKQGE